MEVTGSRSGKVGLKRRHNSAKSLFYATFCCETLVQLSATQVLISRLVSAIIFADEDSHRLNAGGRILLKNQRGEIITAKYVVITVPLTILKDRDITFVPELPANKNRAINTIQMLGAWKIICQFKRRFWPEKLHQIYSVRGFTSEIWMWSRDSAVNDDKCHVVVGFETAESAEQKSVLSGRQVLEGFLSYLDEMFG